MKSVLSSELDLVRETTLRESLETPQADASVYRHEYNTKERLASYWHQVDEVLKFQPRNVLEIGTGSGFTHRALQKEGITAWSLDIALDLGPDIIGSVRALPLADASVDVVVCCQVLEHLPFKYLEESVEELWRVAAKGLVISLPDRERYFRLSLAAWNRFRNYFWEVPRSPSRRPYVLDPQHYWEIGQGDVGRQDVVRAIRNVTGQEVRTYRVFENPYHRFFIVAKSEANP